MKVHFGFALLLLASVFFAGCQSLQPFSQTKGYDFEKDPLASFYRENLVSIKGKAFDSGQVSNKHLDPKMIEALEKLNLLLKDPSDLPDDIKGPLKRAKLTKVTIASASRSPLHQASLSGDHKASPFTSNHLLGLAVDLEMKGKPFDIKRRGTEDEVKETYKALGKAMATVGLFFSEPRRKDPNHVELIAMSRKSNHLSFDFEIWQRHALSFYKKMERRISKISKTYPRGPQRRMFERQLKDLVLRIDEIRSLKDPRILGGTHGLDRN